jgi:hypothetical protein
VADEEHRQEHSPPPCITISGCKLTVDDMLHMVFVKLKNQARKPREELLGPTVPAAAGGARAPACRDRGHEK